MKMYILDNGKIVMSGNNNVTLEKDANVEPPAIPIHTFLLDTDEGYILFDTACDPEGVHGVWPDWLMTNPYLCAEDSTVTARLKELGISPDEIKMVVLSHLHMDHAGSLKDFPKAQTYVQEDELLQVLKNYVNGELEGTFHLKSDVESWLKAGIRWRLVSNEVKELPIARGVTILNCGSGHSFGMLALLVELECGNFLLAADSIYSRMHFGPPAQMAGVCADETGYYQTIEWLRDYAKEHKAMVLFGHDMEQFSSLVKSSEGFYQ